MEPPIPCGLNARPALGSALLRSAAWRCCSSCRGFVCTGNGSVSTGAEPAGASTAHASSSAAWASARSTASVAICSSAEQSQESGLKSAGSPPHSFACRACSVGACVLVHVVHARHARTQARTHAHLNDSAAEAQKLAVKALGLVAEGLHHHATCVAQRLHGVGRCKKCLILGHELVERVLRRRHRVIHGDRTVLRHAKAQFR